MSNLTIEKKNKREMIKRKKKRRGWENMGNAQRGREEKRCFFIYFLIFKWDMPYLHGCEVSVKNHKTYVRCNN